MAKKKTDASPPTTKSNSGAKAKAAKAGKEDAKPQAAKKVAAPKRPLTCEEIGHVAGDVWRALADGGEQSVASLKKAVGAPEELVLAALGWLAREDKLAFEANGKSVTVSLA